MEVLAGDLRGLHVYRLMTSAIIPRPIAWTGTVIGWCRQLGAVFVLHGGKFEASGIGHIGRSSRARCLKDTAQNILDTGVFTVSMVSTESLQDMVDTSAKWPPQTSEFEALCLDLTEGTQVAAPWPSAARVAMECRLVHTHDMGTTHLFVGEIEVFHIDESVLQLSPDGIRWFKPNVWIQWLVWAGRSTLF